MLWRLASRMRPWHQGPGLGALRQGRMDLGRAGVGTLTCGLWVALGWTDTQTISCTVFPPCLSPGIHTLQLHVNCVLDGDTPVRGQFHFAFDGQDFLILERNQSAWVPLAPEASNEMHFWDAGHTWTLFAREFLQEECVDTLRSLLRGGMEALGRQVPPGISVTYRDTPQGAATLCCHARGFYPRPIRVSWVRDGAQILPPMDASRFLPHADSTYQIRQSLEIPQRWGHSYACQVPHSLGAASASVPTQRQAWGWARGQLPSIGRAPRDSVWGSGTWGPQGWRGGGGSHCEIGNME
uniref:Ig-like domain-containing protein n=1 Tax=Chelonoidis abingdonii TaxID=106734 RepID=A0A8C0IW54_CHEAB